MTECVKLTLVTEIGTDQDILVTGRTALGPIEVQIPAEAAGIIMSALSGAKNLRDTSSMGLRAYLQTKGYALQASDHPDQIVLELHFHPEGKARFAFPRTILRDLGQDFVKWATGQQTKVARKPS